MRHHAKRNGGLRCAPIRPQSSIRVYALSISATASRSVPSLSWPVASNVVIVSIWQVKDELTVKRLSGIRTIFGGYRSQISIGRLDLDVRVFKTFPVQDTCGSKSLSMGPDALSF